MGSLIADRPSADADRGVIPAKDGKKYREMMQVLGAENWVNRVIQFIAPTEDSLNEEAKLEAEVHAGRSGPTIDRVT